MTVLAIDNLSIEFPTSKGLVHAVSNFTLSVPQGRRIGFIGESGSGKTTTALAAMRMLAAPGRIAKGEIHLMSLGQTDIVKLNDDEMRRVRLRKISYIPQGAMNSLNPVMRIEKQIWDGIVAHEGTVTKAELKRRATAVLESVGLSARVGRLYPHELSGGMKQRVCIAIGVCLQPDLIIADEPTSALDVITQRHVMQTLRKVQETIGAGLILIGHDMGLMAQSVDDLAVMRLGELVEFGPVKQVLEAPKHPYTRELISSVPVVGGESFLDNPPAAVAGASAQPSQDVPLLAFESVSKIYGKVAALHPVSFTLDGAVPKIISIVGQSGSGKTTMGSLMLGFSAPSKGRVLFQGRDINRLSAVERMGFRRNVQAVFQDPYACFNPFYRVDHALTYPFKRFGLAQSPAHMRDEMEKACMAVGLDPSAVLRRYPHQLSGGQRQRLVVARALMLSPKLLIADEPVSMVDASLRATILKNIYDLKDKQGISILYITHDLATAYHVSDYVMVLYRGHVVEAGPPKDVIGDPQHDYTRLLIDSIPWPDLARPWGSAEETREDLDRLDRMSADPQAILRGDVAGFTLATA